MKMWQKLFLGFVIVITIVAIEGYVCIHLSQNELQKNIEETSASLASEILDSINANLDGRIETIQEHSSASTIQQAASESNKEFEKLDNIQVYINDKDREWMSVSQKETTPFMQEIIGNEVSDELRNIAGFYEKKYHYKVFNEFIITNKYGANIAQTGKTTGYYQGDERWWLQRDGKTYENGRLRKTGNDWPGNLSLQTVANSSQSSVNIFKFWT